MKKIGFILPSNVNNPLSSTRISVLNMLPFYFKNGYEPHIIYQPEQNSMTPNINKDDMLKTILDNEIGIVYFQKVHGYSIEQLTKLLKKYSIKIIYGNCDIIEN